MIVYANTNHNKAGVAIFISDKVELRTRNIIKDKITNYKRIKSSRRPTILNIHVSTNRP